MILAEEMWYELLKDYNHWLFEFISGGIQFIVIGLFLSPLFKRWLKAHDERKHAHEHCEDVHQETLF